MDSKTIYLEIKLLINNVNWQTEGNEEWIFIGKKKNGEVKKELIHSIILDFFKSEAFYINLGPKKSKILTWKEAPNEIFSRIENENFYLANIELNKLIEFDVHGVARKGIY